MGGTIMRSCLNSEADVLETEVLKYVRYVIFFVIKGTAVKSGNSLVITVTSPLGTNRCFEYLERKQHSLMSYIYIYTKQVFFEECFHYVCPNNESPKQCYFSIIYVLL